MRFALASLLATAACHGDELVQYDDYRPPNELPLGEPSSRVDGGPLVEAGVVDGGAPLAVDDASAPPQNSCEAPRDLGTVSGDTTGPALTASGTCSEWLGFRATEDASSGVPMRLRFALTPEGGAFSLFVSFDPIRDVVTCSSVAASTGTSTWGEGSVPNGGDDSRTIRVAVIKRGACGAERWSLRVEGNPP